MVGCRTIYFLAWKKNQIWSTVPYKTYVLKSCNLRSTKTCASFDWLILFWNNSLDNEILNTVGIYCLIDKLSTMSYVNFNCSTIACQKQILYMGLFKPCVGGRLHRNQYVWLPVEPPSCSGLACFVMEQNNHTPFFGTL